ncbi:hypothetical protein GH714_009482 [Hevea brasiliensis]|uniref:Uncharacterized protein n=1 Tax=Hevea brasiliensis TaxID=3981 RepID=A0A6A6N235_HEVBR|nr:hypothetical protein GH714_009482 [Hevea brasiliensis]
MTSLPYADVDFSLRSIAAVQRDSAVSPLVASMVRSITSPLWPAADKEEAKSGLIISEGDVFLNGAQSCLLTGVGEECVFHPSEYYPTWTLEAPSDSLKAVVQICAGWQSIPRPEEMIIQ